MSQQNIIAVKLTEAREAAGKTQAEAAKHLGMTYQAISNWERSHTRIDSESLLKLLAFYETDARQFMISCGFTMEDPDETPKPKEDPDAKEVAAAYQRLPSTAEKNMVRRSLGLRPLEGEKQEEPQKIIPLFGTAAAAGPGEMDTGLPWERYPVPADSNADFAVRISGDSMEPLMHDGQIVLCEEKSPQVGDIAVMMVNGALLIKQYISDGHNTYLRSYNRERRDLDLDIWETGNDTVVCYGIAIMKKRPPLVDQ